MNFNTFITLYTNKQKNGGLEDFVKSHMKNKYVPLEEKQARANIVVENTFYEKDENGDKYIHVNSVANHIFTVLTLVHLYTDIEIDFKKALEQYNKMKECGCLEAILSLIDKSELEEYKFVQNGIQNDVMTNEYEIHSYITKQVDRFSTLFGTIIQPFLDKIDTEAIIQGLEQFNLK